MFGYGKNYHAAAVCAQVLNQGIQPVISEPKDSRRKWRDERRRQQAFYTNRVQVRSDAGKRRLRQRGELIEPAFAHYLDGGGMRRVWIQGQENIAKRLWGHVAQFNLGLWMRKLIGEATPRACGRAGRGSISLRPYFALTGLGVAVWHAGHPHCADDYGTAEVSVEMLRAARFGKPNFIHGLIVG